MQSWLDNVALAFADDPLPLGDWLPILEAGLAGLTVGVIPPALDHVLVGTIDRSRNPELELALQAKPDYVALGPIYPTILKEMRFAPQGLDTIGEWKRRIGDLPLVAIGGITLERAPGVLAAGADSIAVVTDVLRNADPEARARAFVDVTRGTPSF